MKKRLGVIMLFLVSAAALLLATGPLHSADGGCVFEDARISGKEILSFTDPSSGEAVSIVLGGFRLSVGKRYITGRDAVVWIRSSKVGPATRNYITVYVEGDARAVAADGTTTSDKAMLVGLLQQGRLSAAGNMSSRSLESFPLYKRGAAIRRGAARRKTVGKPARRRAPKLIRIPAGKVPAKPKPVPPKPAAVEKPTAPKMPLAVLPVHFNSDRFTSQIEKGKRITIARGNVYLAQGSPRSSLYLELRSQAAVLFSEKLKKAKTGRSPLSPRAGAGQETITGVYLKGDVVIARGERYLRSEEAYYDFITDRAYVPDAVMRTIQKQRNIPIYIRADEIRILSAREMHLRNAKVTTSDFYSPSYHIGVREAYLMDTTPYDEKGQPLGPQGWLADMKHTTFNIRSVPVAYTPFWKGDLQHGHTALRKVQVGSHGDLGFGVETEWHLFRLLGLVRPEGVRARYELDWYEDGVLTGIKYKYARQNELRRYSGYGRIFGLFSGSGDDNFGDEREDITAPGTRGRAMWRHKEYLPHDWEAQFELSYLCDRNFLERYWPTEFFAGKEQETLIYAKKQRDNWAFTVLAKYRINRFLTQDEAMPDLGLHLIGEPLLGDRLTFFSESHAGLRRFVPANDSDLDRSNIFARLDTREEINFPFRVGPITVVPYAVGRLTYWCDAPDDSGEDSRLYGQVGARASANIWRLYGDVSSRLWNLDGLRHIITPEVAVFFSDTGNVSPDELFPLDPDVEEHLRRQNGFSLGVYQRLQPKRGPAGNRHITDWMRLAVVASFFDNGPDGFPADGKFYLYRPEYSLGRNHVNVDYSWYISDSTTFLADLNYDTNRGKIGRAAAGLSVVRSPRLAYYAGMRVVPDMDSAIGIFGAKYKINRKYSVSFFEEYDFDFRGKRNLATNLSIVRKLPRWYVAVTFTFDQSNEGDSLGMMISFWPEGIPEVRIGARSDMFGKSDEN